jgi:hypothetical protein
LFFCFLVTIALGAPHAQADSILNLTVDPSSVSGAPGDTVGWGFTLIDTSDVYSAIVLASDFCPGGVLASPCSTNGEPSLGVYTDNISSGPDFFLNPGDSDTETAGEFGGFGSLAIDAGLGPGTYTGLLVLYYDVVDSDFNLIDSDIYTTAPFSLTVTGSESPTTPEPATLLLLGTGLVGIARRLRPKGESQWRHRINNG